MERHNQATKWAVFGAGMADGVLDDDFLPGPVQEAGGPAPHEAKAPRRTFDTVVAQFSSMADGKRHAEAIGLSLSTTSAKGYVSRVLLI